MNRIRQVRKFNEWLAEHYGDEMRKTGRDGLDYMLSLSRANQLAIHDAYLVDQYPEYAKLKTYLEIGPSGLYECTLCRKAFGETLLNMKGHFDIRHKDINLSGGERNLS